MLSMIKWRTQWHLFLNYIENKLCYLSSSEKHQTESQFFFFLFENMNLQEKSCFSKYKSIIINQK